MLVNQMFLISCRATFYSSSHTFDRLVKSF